MVIINGKEEPGAAGALLSDWLASSGRLTERVAVEKNGEIVPRALYGKTRLEDGDRVEIVSFVGGG